MRRKGLVGMGKISKSAIKALAATQTGQALVRDTELPGFGVRTIAAAWTRHLHARSSAMELRLSFKSRPE
jgi:hypothetical protein